MSDTQNAGVMTAEGGQASQFEQTAAIVIVGGGAGGLELAARLGRRLGRRHGRGHVLLIDRAPLHIWKPTLHEVAAGTLDMHAEGLSYPMLARRNRFSFALGEMVSLDIDRRCLTLAPIEDGQAGELVPQRQVRFDRLVLALGSGSNFFGTPGAEQAFVLENTHDAERFRQRLLAAFMRATLSSDRQLSLAIVGGGATGVELSAELLEAHAEVLESLGDAQRFAFDITIVEAAPRILAGLSERISTLARTALERRGVSIRTDTKVLAVQEDGLQTSAGPLAAHLTVWAAGIQAAPAHAGFGLAVNRQYQFLVDDRMQTSASGIYALGDNAACSWRDGKILPARAQVASQQATYLAQTFASSSSAPPAPFVYRDLGSLVSLGEDRGVGNLMGSLSGRSFFVDGLLAKWMYMSLHLMHHRAVLGVRATAVLALARLLKRRVSGRVKLH